MNKHNNSYKLSDASTVSMVSSPELNAIKTPISNNVTVLNASSLASHKINIHT